MARCRSPSSARGATPTARGARRTLAPAPGGSAPAVGLVIEAYDPIPSQMLSTTLSLAALAALLALRPAVPRSERHESGSHPIFQRHRPIPGTGPDADRYARQVSPDRPRMGQRERAWDRGGDRVSSLESSSVFQPARSSNSSAKGCPIPGLAFQSSRPAFPASTCSLDQL